MENFILGFLTGGSLILAIGPQNLFVIEQGLKKNYIFTITTICAVSDVLLIFLGVFIYYIFDSISLRVEIILNVILVLFLLRYIREKYNSFDKNYKIKDQRNSKNLNKIIIKTPYLMVVLNKRNGYGNLEMIIVIIEEVMVNVLFKDTKITMVIITNVIITLIKEVVIIITNVIITLIEEVVIINALQIKEGVSLIIKMVGQRLKVQIIIVGLIK